MVQRNVCYLDVTLFSPVLLLLLRLVLLLTGQATVYPLKTDMRIHDAFTVIGNPAFEREDALQDRLVMNPFIVIEDFKGSTAVCKQCRGENAYIRFKITANLNKIADVHCFDIPT